LYQPQIIKKIETADGVGITEIEPTQTGKLPVSTKTMNIIKRGLWEAVNTRGGTARRIRHKEFSISGKTGTAQLVARKEPEEEMRESEEEELADHLKPHAWFVAYAPSEDPLIAIAVMVEHGEHGSSAAAPIAREIIQTYLNRTNRKSQIASTKIQMVRQAVRHAHGPERSRRTYHPEPSRRANPDT
jgi:penicillin-binding protein 2